MASRLFEQLTRHAHRPISLLAAVLFAWFFCCPPARAQDPDPAPQVPQQLQRRTVPTDSYFFSFANFYEGRYSDALKDFNRELRGAIKTPQSRWIDSICYFTMRGETYYQMGRLPEALADYTAALELLVAFDNWMVRVDFPQTIRPAGGRVGADAPWGQTRRGAKKGLFPRTVLIGQGSFVTPEDVRRGGAIQTPVFFPINATEVVRCTCLAIRRRAELLGPAAPHDRLTKDVEATLNRRPGLLNHWSEVWIDLQLGLAQAASGKLTQAKTHLERSLLAAGEFDHPLTGIALLELGKIALAEGDVAKAAGYFLETTYAVMRYPLMNDLEDATLLEEAMHLGFLAHLVSNQPGIYPPLEAAALWARRQDYDQLHASLLIDAGENMLALGQARQAEGVLNQAAGSIGRRDMRAGRIGAKLNYVSARLLYQQGRQQDADRRLLAALDYERRGSLRVFQIAVADRLYREGVFSPRIAMQVYQQTLSGPSPGHWTFEPLEALALLHAPLDGPLGNWFEVALERRENAAAVEISDLARRHHFLSSLPWAGRRLALRWVLEAPEAALSEPARLQRRDLLTRYPDYQASSEQAQQLRLELRQGRLLTEDQDSRQKQAATLAEWNKTAEQREAWIARIAAARQPAELVFPPVWVTAEIQSALPANTGILSFFAGPRQVHGIFLSRDDVEVWPIGPPERLRKQVALLLQQLGQRDASRDVQPQQLTDQSWKETSSKLLAGLTDGITSQFPGSLEELIVVPTDVLWYVPFEALHHPAGPGGEPLVAQMRIRYSPLVSLATAELAPSPGRVNSALVAGRLYPREDPSVVEGFAESLRELIPSIETLAPPMPAPPAVLASLIDQLIVWHDLNDSADAPYAWSPLPDQRGTPRASLADWLQLPWGAPSQLVLPGFHSAAESAIRTRGRSQTWGDDLFLPICGLMASGSRTILISRWRVGGQSTEDLLREFVQELPHTSPADAWQRSVFMLMNTPLMVDAEPRVARDPEGLIGTADHPFFWGGYLLVDAGTEASGDHEPAAGVAAAIDEP